MGKLTRDQRIELYQMYKEGWAIGALSREYGICKENVKYLIRLIDEHGITVLRDGKCRKYAPALKEQIVKEVLVDGNSITKTALKYGLSSKTALSKWIQNYQANQGVIVEKQRGRKPKDVGGGGMRCKAIFLSALMRKKEQSKKTITNLCMRRPFAIAIARGCGAVMRG